jgi:hypothetical protein
MYVFAVLCMPNLSFTKGKTCPAAFTREKKRTIECWSHRVGRVLSFFSSRLNWDSPTPLAAGECAPPPFGPGGGNTRLRLKGCGSPNSDEGTCTVVLYKYKYFVVGADRTWRGLYGSPWSQNELVNWHSHISFNCV